MAESLRLVASVDRLLNRENNLAHRA
jgi:hypothetical protein